MERADSQPFKIWLKLHWVGAEFRLTQGEGRLTLNTEIQLTEIFKYLLSLYCSVTMHFMNQLYN